MGTSVHSSRGVSTTLEDHFLSTSVLILFVYLCEDVHLDLQFGFSLGRG